MTRFRRVGVECEIAVTLASDLPPRETPYDAETVVGAVAACMAAIEVVDDRYIDFAALGVPTLIADDFFQAACVLGDPIPDWRALDLARVEGRVNIDGQTVGRGEGAAVLGHPMEALAWLANRLSSLGRGLVAGEFVLLGSLTPVQWLEKPCRVTIDLGPLGGASAEFH